jgi:hypothetical protein
LHKNKQTQNILEEWESNKARSVDLVLFEDNIDLGDIFFFRCSFVMAVSLGLNVTIFSVSDKEVTF